MSSIELDDLSDRLATLILNSKPIRPKASPRSSSEFLSGDTVRPRTSKTQINERASPHSTPSVTFRSTPTNMSPDLQTGRNTPSSGRESPVTGKTPVMVHQKSIPRATSRRQTGPSSGPTLNMLNSEFTSRDFSAEPEDFQDDTLLEPYPYERVRTNVSEMFAVHTRTFDSCVNLTGFGGHRDTFAILGLRRRQPRDIELPASFFERLLRYIDFETYLAIRLSCRSWSATLSQVRTPPLKPVYHLPAEVLEQIYYHLSPVDFNAARHTCRAWMVTSLDTRLLIQMLKRGGWSAAALADEAIIECRPQMAITNEWPLSKRLSTECQLRPEWTGNGLPHRSYETSPLELSKVARYMNRAALSLTVEINFSELSLWSLSRSDSQHDAGRLFTPSACGQYLLVTVDCSIFVYTLNKKASYFDQADAHGVGAITSVVCSRRVLAVSMNTTYGRLAVAALLEGRVGLVCDLETTQAPYKQSSGPQLPLDVWRHSSNTCFEISGNDVEIEDPLPNVSLAFHNSHGKMVPWAKQEMPFTTSPERYSACSSPNGVPVEKGPRSIYRNLCSAEDPPRSVAICPQRRCVAFGCSAGIELHWTDVLSGQDMNRWFPLAHSSDYLYFVPPALDVDSVKRLRLTSSAAHPSEKASLDARFGPELQETREDERIWECTSNLGFHNTTSGREQPKPDHYRTVPLSDGYHALFTDAETGCVCLGRLPDAPANDVKLLKRIVLPGPKSGDADKGANTPKCYAAAPDLSWGVRIAVGYTDGSLWLFSIPRDIVTASSRDEQNWEPEWAGEYSVFGRKDQAIHVSEDRTGLANWPVQIQGTQVATIDALEDVSVDASNGSVSLWVFSHDGLVKKWKISQGIEKQVRKSIVLRNGKIVDAEEDDSDWIMENAPWIPSYVSTPAGYDGTTSALGFHPAWNLNSLSSLPRSDTAMTDPDSGYGSDKGEPSTSINIDLSTLPTRLANMRLSDSDAEMPDADEGYASAIHSRVPSPMDIDIPTPPSQYLPEIPLRNSQRDRDNRDEGYESEKPSRWAGSPFAICIPPLNNRWSGVSFEEHDWTPDYMGTKGRASEDVGADEDLDLLDFAKVEVEIL